MSAMNPELSMMEINQEIRLKSNDVLSYASIEGIKSLQGQVDRESFIQEPERENSQKCASSHQDLKFIN
jgi:hypothetical protein